MDILRETDNNHTFRSLDHRDFFEALDRSSSSLHAKRPEQMLHTLYIEKNLQVDLVQAHHVIRLATIYDAT